MIPLQCYVNLIVAYKKIISDHSLSKGSEYAEAEWLSGWIALSFLNDENLALLHFENFYNNVGYPISLSRGAYWIGRTYKKLGSGKKHLKTLSHVHPGILFCERIEQSALLILQFLSSISNSTEIL